MEIPCHFGDTYTISMHIEVGKEAYCYRLASPEPFLTLQEDTHQRFSVSSKALKHAWL